MRTAFGQMCAGHLGYTADLSPVRTRLWLPNFRSARAMVPDFRLQSTKLLLELYYTRAKFSSVLFDGLCLPPCLKCKLCCKRLSLTRPYCCSLHTAPVQPLPPAPSSSPPRKRAPRTHMTSRSFGGSSTRVQPHLHGEILSQGTRECVLRIDHTSKSCPLYPRLHLAE